MRRLLPDVLDLRLRDPRMEATSCEAAIGSSPIPTATSRPSPAAVIAPWRSATGVLRVSRASPCDRALGGFAKVSTAAWKPALRNGAGPGGILAPHDGTADRSATQPLPARGWPEPVAARGLPGVLLRAPRL